jgi:hypothetical protein
MASLNGFVARVRALEDRGDDSQIPVGWVIADGVARSGNQELSLEAYHELHPYSEVFTLRIARATAEPEL